MEKNGKAIDVLRNNLRSLGDEAYDRGVVMKADAWDPPIIDRAIWGASREDEGPSDKDDAEVAPDVVFLDPPYSMVAEDPVKSMARARRILDRVADKGCVLFHFESGVLDEDDFDNDLDVDLREWGSSVIAILWRKGDAPESVQKRHAKSRARNPD